MRASHQIPNRASRLGKWIKDSLKIKNKPFPGRRPLVKVSGLALDAPQPSLESPGVRQRLLCSSTFCSPAAPNGPIYATNGAALPQSPLDPRSFLAAQFRRCPHQLPEAAEGSGPVRSGVARRHWRAQIKAGPTRPAATHSRCRGLQTSPSLTLCFFVSLSQSEENKNKILQASLQASPGD